MRLVETEWHVISALLIFLVGWLIVIRIGRVLRLSLASSSGLYVWHSIFCYLYAAYATQNVADAVSYYLIAARGQVDFSFGTAAVTIVTWPFVNLLGLSFLGANLVFNIAGTIGLLAFYASLREGVRGSATWVRIAACIMVLLPSVSFWSSAIGKDSLSFMAIGLALWAALMPARRLWLLAFSMGVMVLVRPHMAGIMAIAWSISLLGGSRLPPAKKFALLLLAVAVSGILVPFGLRYAGLEGDVGVTDVASYIEQRQALNLEGGGGVDISTLNPLMRIFTYLFRPLPFEAHSITTLAASVDNTILLLLMLASVRGFFFVWKKSGGVNRAFLWWYSLIGLFLLASTTANSGIAVRQKWMLVPILIYLLISAAGLSRKRESRI